MTGDIVLVLHALGWAGYVLLAGVLVFWVVVWPEGSRDRRLATLAFAGTALLALGFLGDPLVRLTGGDEAVDDLLDPLAASALLVRLAGLAAATFFLPDLLSGPVRGSRQLFAGLLVILLTAGVLAGATGVDDRSTLGLLAAIAHALAAAAWVGGLVALAVLLLPRAGVELVDPLLEPFARLATACLLLLLASGVVQALVVAGDPGTLVTSTFGLVVLVKTGLLGLMVALGARVRSRLSAAGQAAPRPTVVRRAVAGEAVLAGAALAATAALVAVPPG